MKKIYVLDASAILNFRLINLSMLERAYTVPEVLEELKDYHSKLFLSLSDFQLIVKSPEEEFIRKVRAFAQDRGFLRRLSETDLKVLALAKELAQRFNTSSVILLTDDYTLQNLAALMRLNFHSLIRPGIKQAKKRLIYVCPVCGIRCQGTRCPRCGSRCLPKLL